MKDKNHMFISIHAKKASDKLQQPFMIKNSQQITEGMYCNIIKAIYNIIYSIVKN